MPEDFVLFNMTMNSVYRYVFQKKDSWHKYVRSGAVWSFIDNVGDETAHADYYDKENEVYQRHKRIGIEPDARGPLRITVTVPESPPDIQMVVAMREVWREFTRETSAEDRAAAARWLMEWINNQDE